jgi:hypothetical protein
VPKEEPALDLSGEVGKEEDFNFIPNAPQSNDDLLLLILYAIDHNINQVVKILESQPDRESLIRLATMQKVDDQNGIDHANAIYCAFLNSTSTQSKRFREANPEVATIVDLFLAASQGKYPHEVLPKWRMEIM